MSSPRHAARRTAHVLGYVVIASRRHTDLYEWGQRSTPFSLSAEIQRRLLPPAYTCEAGSFTLAAWLEPADTIAGDTFDYSLGRDQLHLSVTDAVGHGVASSLTATLCVGSLRNTRRHGATLLEQAGTTNEALLADGCGPDGERFATALLGRLDLPTGELELVNAGHAAPYLARDGQVRMLELPADLPLGLFEQSTYRSTTVPLLAGDRIVIVTDGMLERAAASVDLEVHVRRTRDLHPREATRESPTSSSPRAVERWPTTRHCSCSTGTGTTARRVIRSRERTYGHPTAERRCGPGRRPARTGC